MCACLFGGNSHGDYFLGCKRAVFISNDRRGEGKTKKIKNKITEKKKKKKGGKKQKEKKTSEDQGKCSRNSFSKSKFHLDSLLSPLGGASAH